MNLKKRAERGNVDAALAILDAVPDIGPDPGDEPVGAQAMTDLCR